MSLDTKSVTDAIIRLAGTMGSIFNIISASDTKAVIFTKGQEVYDLINKTATDTEKNKLPTLQEVKQIRDAVNQFATLVIKEKMMNPLISDDLISMVNTVTKNAAAIMSLYITV